MNTPPHFRFSMSHFFTPFDPPWALPACYTLNYLSICQACFSWLRCRGCGRSGRTSRFAPPHNVGVLALGRYAPGGIRVGHSQARNDEGEYNREPHTDVEFIFDYQGLRATCQFITGFEKKVHQPRVNYFHPQIGVTIDYWSVSVTNASKFLIA